MNMIMPVLVKKKNCDDPLYDNTNDTLEKAIEYLKKEVVELEEAIKEGDKVHQLEELNDVQQMLIRFYEIYSPMEIYKSNQKHRDKLEKRGWITNGNYWVKKL